MDNFIQKKKKIAIYTAIFGERDNLLEPRLIPDGCDFFCFTDQPFSSTIWKTIRVKPLDCDPCRSAKIYKILPHHYLPEYEYTVWMDGNMILCGDITPIITEYLGKNDIAFFKHPDGRNCIYEEAVACISLSKDNPEVIKNQIEFYRQQGYPERNGLISCGIIFRRNTLKINKINEDWWEIISRYSKRDQLSFNYIAFKNHLSYSTIYENIRDNKCFKMVSHKKKKKGLLEKFLNFIGKTLGNTNVQKIKT